MVEPVSRSSYDCGWRKRPVAVECALYYETRYQFIASCERSGRYRGCYSEGKRLSFSTRTCFKSTTIQEGKRLVDPIELKDNGHSRVSVSIWDTLDQSMRGIFDVTFISDERFSRLRKEMKLLSLIFMVSDCLIATQKLHVATLSFPGVLK